MHMHKDFGEWYRLVSIEPNDALLKSRWAGIDSWYDGVTRDLESQLHIVRLFFGRPNVSIEAKDNLIAALREHDSAYPQRNELELRVLAGAAAVRCLGEPADDEVPETATAVALAVTAGTFNGETSLEALPEICEYVGKYLRDASRWERQRWVGSAEAVFAATTKDVDKLAGGNYADTNQLRDAIVPLLKSLMGDAETAGAIIENLQHDLRCADEECNMLWWLVGGVSRDLNQAWGKIGKDGVPIIAAKELADLTTVMPGPEHVGALCQSVTSAAKCREVVFSDAINGVPKGWLTEAVGKIGENTVLDLTPVWQALRQRAQASDDTAWQSYFERVSGVHPGRTVKPDKLAHQAYTEALLLRALREGEE